MGWTDRQGEKADGVWKMRGKAWDGTRLGNDFLQVSCGMQGSSAHGQTGIRVWCHRAKVHGEQRVHGKQGVQGEQWVQGEQRMHCEQRELGASGGCWQTELAVEGGYPERSSEMP